jgi:hypothetical protein
MLPTSTPSTRFLGIADLEALQHLVKVLVKEGSYRRSHSSSDPACFANSDPLRSANHVAQKPVQRLVWRAVRTDVMSSDA